MEEYFTGDVLEQENSCNEGFKLPDFNYERIKRIVTDLVEKLNVTSIPIDVFKLAKKLRIKLVPFSKISIIQWKKFIVFGIHEDNDGFFVLAEKNGREVPFIFYDDSKNKGRIRFTILHEIGHYVLGHKQQSTLAEAEANFFAKYFIAPPVIVHQTSPNDYVDIMIKFDLSTDCAWNAFSYYTKWLNHVQRAGNVLAEYEKKLLCYMGKQAM